MSGPLLGRFRSWLRRDDGLSSIMFALLLPALLGAQALTVDVTTAYVTHRRLQTAADAGALAAAVYLPTSNTAVLAQARAAAIDYAARNDVTVADEDVTFSTGSQANDRVTVRATATVNFSFAPMLGVTFAAVSREGGAQLGQAGGLAGVLPLGVTLPEGGLAFGDAYCLKLGSGHGSSECNSAARGNFQALDIDNEGSSSASVYEDHLESGSINVVEVGETRPIVTGNMQGPTNTGIGCDGGGRLNGDASTFEGTIVENPWGGYTVQDWTNPRLAIIPIVSFDSSNATVLGFAVFFIDACGGNGEIIGRFIDTMVPGGEWTPLSGSSNFGTRVIRLVH